MGVVLLHGFNLYIVEDSELLPNIVCGRCGGGGGGEGECCASRRPEDLHSPPKPRPPKA